MANGDRNSGLCHFGADGALYLRGSINSEAVLHERYIELLNSERRAGNGTERHPLRALSPPHLELVSEHQDLGLQARDRNSPITVHQISLQKSLSLLKSPQARQRLVILAGRPYR